MLPAQDFKRNFVSRSSSISPLRPRNSKNENCPCMRPKARIVCSACSFIGEGRVKQPCPKHSRVVFINDFSQCPNCGAYDFMLTEYY